MRKFLADYCDSGLFASCGIMGVVLFGVSLIMYIMQWIG